MRLFLVQASSATNCDSKKENLILSALDAAKRQAAAEKFGAEAVVREIELYLENTIRYRSDCSALIALSIGLASLDLPVLIVTIISEYLVSINEDKLFGQYPEHKNWKIASLIKKKSKEN